MTKIQIRCILSASVQRCPTLISPWLYDVRAKWAANGQMRPCSFRLLFTLMIY